MSARWLQAATLALVLGVIGRNAMLFRSFNAEARGFNDIVAAAAPSPRLIYLAYDAGAKGFVTSPFLHFSAYVQAEKGGTINFSFAQAPVAVMQYRPGAPPARATCCTCSRTCSTGASTATTTTSWSARARPTRAICFQPMRPRLAAHAGRWWLFRKSNPTGGNSRRVGPTGARLSYLPSLVAPPTCRIRQPLDAAPGKSKPRARCSVGISAIFAVVITPTLATVGAEVRLILSTTEIAATHLHCLPT